MTGQCVRLGLGSQSVLERFLLDLYHKATGPLVTFTHSVLGREKRPCLNESLGNVQVSVDC
jgi:hypothetical protein